MEKILLASSSPRRREILSSLGIDFVILAPDLDESIRDDLDPAPRVTALALDKAKTIAARAVPGMPRLVLGSDTLVCLPDGTEAEKVLGKPEGMDDARRMIKMLAGKMHVVHTGLALIDRENGREWTARSDSSVRFAAMSSAEIEDYLASGEWEGAAGGYRVQERASFYIDRIEGSWSGIVGLPIRELYGILRQAGFRLGPRA
jgi:septum formation protein